MSMNYPVAETTGYQQPKIIVIALLLAFSYCPYIMPYYILKTYGF
jgi:hypothetical protein